MLAAYCPECQFQIDVDAGILCPNPDCESCRNRNDGRDLIVLDRNNGQKFFPKQSPSTNQFKQNSGQQISSLQSLSLPEATQWYCPPLPTHGTLIIGEPTHWFFYFLALGIGGTLALAIGGGLICLAIEGHKIILGFLIPGIIFCSIPIIIFIYMKKVSRLRNWIDITPTTLSCSHGTPKHRGSEFFVFKRNPNDTTPSLKSHTFLGENGFTATLEDKLSHKSFEVKRIIFQPETIVEMLNSLLNADLNSQKDSKKGLNSSAESDFCTKPQ